MSTLPVSFPVSILVHVCCCNGMLEGRQLTKNGIYFTSVMDTGKSKIKTPLALLLCIRWRGGHGVLMWQKSWRE